MYSAQFEMPKASSKNYKNRDEWNRVKIPFSLFQLVLGPRLVAGAPPVIVTEGLYQIGMTLSKFIFAENMTSLENFRPGFLELQIKKIGVYAKESTHEKVLNITNETCKPIALSKKESDRKKHLLLKIMLPLFRALIASEKSNRRKSALKILTERRGMSRIGAIVFGIRARRQKHSVVAYLPSLFQTLQIVYILMDLDFWQKMCCEGVSCIHSWELNDSYCM